MSTKHTGIKKQVLKELSKHKVGLTNFELSEKLGLTKQQIQDSLRESAATNYVIKGENLGAEGINYTISNAGLAYLKRNGEKSALTQTEKTTVETVEPAPIVEESALEQNENLRKNLNFRHAIEDFEITNSKTIESRELEPVINDSLTTEIEDFETRAFVAKNAVDLENPVQNLLIAIDLYAKSIQPPPRKVHNLEIKIELLEKLADDFNPQISNVLKMIIGDLQ